MRVLLDEDIPIRLRHHFPDGFEVETVEYRGWKGLKNGDLLRAAQHHFDVFVTTDNNLPDQQPIQHFDLAVVILRARSKSLDHLAQLLPQLQAILGSLRPGDCVRVEASRLN